MPRSKIDELIETHFPWGQSGCPVRPSPPNRGVERNAVDAWLQKQVRESGLAALALIARATPVVKELEAIILRREGERLVFRIDDSHLSKTPAGILDKMARSWDPPENPRFDFTALPEQMEDLGRFRIVTNFLSDALAIVEAIQNAFGSPTALTPAQRALRHEFSFEKGQFHDLAHMDPAKRKKGERCYKGVFRPRNKPHIRIEVQVQTLLQEAWDKKDHYLIYEPRRRGERVLPAHEREIFAISELLYVADLTFDRLRRDVLDNRHTARSGDDNASA